MTSWLRRWRSPDEKENSDVGEGKGMDTKHGNGEHDALPDEGRKMVSVFSITHLITDDSTFHDRDEKFTEKDEIMLDLLEDRRSSIGNSGARISMGSVVDRDDPTDEAKRIHCAQTGD